MASRPQGPLGIFEAGEALFEHTAKAIKLLEGAALPRVPLCHDQATIAKRAAEPCDCDAQPDEEHKERCRFWAEPPTRECENCGQRKPTEEMSTVFLPGTGESFQCESCRGGP